MMQRSKIVVSSEHALFMERLARMQKDQESLNCFTNYAKSWEDIKEDFEEGLAVQLHQNKPITYITVKDNICVKKWPTTCASKMLSDYVSPFDATVVSRLKSNGNCLVLGKCNMDEFGMGNSNLNSNFGPARHPGRKYVAGGSSGGSAIAVQRDLCDLSVASDTGGSVRLPAACLGIIGFKPSYGRISRFGLVSYASSLDTVGFLSKDVGTIAKALAWCKPRDIEHDETNILSGNDRTTCYEGQKRIGICRGLLELCDPEIATLIEREYRRLAQIGHSIVELDLKDLFISALTTYYIISSTEASSCLARYDGKSAYNLSISSKNSLVDHVWQEGFGPVVYNRLKLGQWLSSRSNWFDNYERATKSRLDLKHRLHSLWNKVDFLMIPTAPRFISEKDAEQQLASEVEWIAREISKVNTGKDKTCFYESMASKDDSDSWKQDIFTVAANLSGLPAISYPIFFPDENFDHGGASMQVIGPLDQDESILDLVARIKK